MLERERRKRNPSTLSVGLSIGATTVENSMEIPQKTKNPIKNWAEHIHNGILLSLKKNKIPVFFATWMDLETIMLSEVSHTMRHQHQMLSLTCGIWKKDRRNFFAEQMLTHRHWKTYGLQRRQFGGWGDVLGLWDGNPVKLDCYDHYTTTDVINSFE